MSNVPSTRLLTRAFQADGIATEYSRDLAGIIKTNPGEVADAAIHWAKTGEFPDWPTLSGHSPRSLADKGLGSDRIFTCLIVLHNSPGVGASALRHLLT